MARYRRHIKLINQFGVEMSSMTLAQHRSKIAKTYMDRLCPKCGQTISSTKMTFGTHLKWCGPAREERFWSKVAKRGPDECWLWTGATFKKKNKQMGYGRYAGDGQFTYAHRCAWIFTHGPIPKDKIIMHSCDVVLCCNPAHLSLGTDAENMLDMHRKGRHPQSRAVVLLD